jgi:hypothetical protein
MNGAWNPYCRGKLSTVELLVKLSKKGKIFSELKATGVS